MTFWKCASVQNERSKEHVSSSQRGAHQQNGAQSTSFFLRVERTNTPSRQSAVSFRSELHSTNCNLPLFLDSLIPYLSCLCLLFSSYPACMPACLPIAGPSFSLQDDFPPELSVTFTCRVSVFQNVHFERTGATLSIKISNEKILCDCHSLWECTRKLSLSTQDLIAREKKHPSALNSADYSTVEKEHEYIHIYFKTVKGAKETT